MPAAGSPLAAEFLPFRPHLIIAGAGLNCYVGCRVKPWFSLAIEKFGNNRVPIGFKQFGVRTRSSHAGIVDNN